MGDVHIFCQQLETKQKKLVTIKKIKNNITSKMIPYSENNFSSRVPDLTNFLFLFFMITFQVFLIEF